MTLESQMMINDKTIDLSYDSDFASALLADWFAQLLIKPLEDAEIEAYHSDAMKEFFSELGEDLACEDIAAALYAELTGNDVKSVQHHLAWLYTSLFEGIAGPRNIGLYESAYYQDGTHLFQQPFVEMQAIMRLLDVSIQNDCKEPADHLSLELAAFAEALRQKNSDEIENMHRRLIGWVPRVSADIAAVAGNSFYHNVFLLLDAYLASFQSDGQTGKDTNN